MAIGSIACSSLVGADFDYAGTREGDGGAATSTEGTGPAIDPFEDPVPPASDGSCPAKRKLCDGLCVSLTDPTYGCGSGCDPCNVAHGTPGCSSGKCVIRACKEHRADCNGTASDGCETATASSPAHCGGCNEACAAGLVCSGGACSSTCKPGETACDGACIDLDVTPEHCGGCGEACPTVANGVATCAGGTCGLACDPGYDLDLSGNCVVEDPTQERITVGLYSACAIRTDGSVVCFGTNATSPQGGTYRQVNARMELPAAVTTSYSPTNWTSVVNPLPIGQFLEVDRADTFACGLRTDHTLACRAFSQSTPAATTTPPAGTFRHLSSGALHSCAVRDDGAVLCWGNGEFGKATPPAGTFRTVSAGIQHTCGIRSDRTLACWGYAGYIADAPVGTFRAVASGEMSSCAIRADGTLVCWGDAAYGILTPPGGAFRQVAVGRYFACGIRVNGTLACWGNEKPTAVPTGTFW